MSNYQTIERNTYYVFEPFKDITIYELAMCINLIVKANELNQEESNRIYNDLPSEAKRHWAKVTQNPTASVVFNYDHRLDD